MECGHPAGASAASLLEREEEEYREGGRERVSADLREIWERTEGEGAWLGGRGTRGGARRDRRGFERLWKSITLSAEHGEDRCGILFGP
jgi:hypothetical protein